MSGLHHKYICPMIDYFEEDRCHFVVMELERGGDLCERINEKVSYSEQDAMIVVRNICEAMEFVHDKGFAHCDIKPRNYLLHSKKDDLDIRLADFGFAQHVHAPNSLTSQCGTPFFVGKTFILHLTFAESMSIPLIMNCFCAAPEVINRKPYDQKVDMWSIGVTAYVLLCGETPFNGKNRQQLFRRISCDDPTFPDDKWGRISDEAVDFVRKLLTKDPAKRLSAVEALRHRWLADSKQHQTKTPSYDKVVDSSEKFSEPIGITKGSQDALNHHSNNTLQRSPPPRASPNVSSTSRQSSSRSARPPPPPPPHASSRAVSEQDDKARLLEVIKEQDAKIERLERMVMRMMEPEDKRH